ncbi:MAG: outer membrane lipoprotein-sorting protein [Candidatus Omnitrophica bacterium]|nr:outer membrane lipoprotein-sorting protein [Candidatus Omnitrophota bacterium]
MKRFSIVLAGFFLLISFEFAYSEESVEQIVDKANKAAYYQGTGGKAKVEMTITDSQGRIRKRVFKILRLDLADGGQQKFYVYFSEPADVEDMTYLVWKHLGRDDDRWLYLPALDLLRRIAASDNRSSFVGSTFVYEDISGRALDQDEHQLISSEGETYLVKNTPISKDSVEFSYYNVYIDKNSYLPIRAEYFNKQGKLSRIVEALETGDVQGYPTVKKSKASDLENGSNTVTEFSEIQYDLGLDESIFTERYLKRPPRKWLD